MAAGLPSSLPAQATYRLGVLQAKAGQTKNAVDSFEKVRTQFPDALSDTGVPLALYSGLHLLESPLGSADTPESRGPMVDAVYAQTITHFPMLAPAILEQIRAERPNDSSRVDAWHRVLEAHNQSRRIAAAAQAGQNERPSRAPDLQPRWIESEPGHNWLALHIPSGSNLWLMAIAETNLAHWVQSSLEPVGFPKYFGLQVSIAEKCILPAEGEELARTELPGSNTRPDTLVSVHLVDAGLLYDRPRARSRWFGALITVCALTMLLGMSAARAAFKRQRTLTELQRNFVASVSHELRAPIASVRSALDSGADDYLGKPFSRDELLARVRALWRRVQKQARVLREVKLGEVGVDFVQQRAFRGTPEIFLTAKEFAMLRLLLENAGEVVSRDRFLDVVWGYTAFPTTRTVDKHIASLRAIEDNPEQPRWIHTVHGVGYRLDTAESSPCDVTKQAQLQAQDRE